MIKRKIQTELAQLANEYPIITITGPRQSGKTTLTQMQFPNHNYVNLEEPETRQLAEKDAKEFLKRYPAPVIIDEIQRLPILLSYIQVESDRTKTKGAFILTGSHQPELRAQVTQSLAGRTAILQLLPLSIDELTEAGVKQDRDEYIFKGFMPKLYDEELDVTRFYRNYYTTYVERDARQLVNIRNFAAFEVFVKLLAGRVGQLVNLSSIANDVGVSTGTISEWLSVLEASYIIFRLPPYFDNFNRRQIKSPKLYFTEVGLAAYLLELENPGMVARDPLIGGLFENLVVVEALKSRYNAGKDANLYFFRDSNNMEIDLLLSANRTLYPMEIKAGRTWSNDFSKALDKFHKLNPKSGEGTVVYSGDVEQGIDDNKLINFTNTAKAMNRK
ncbi:MAG: ATP-binding protein [Victivallales bacterium]|jgi:predicted AAA+ superfamily ATPase|nr:ATP-binding protein [Victivallales bacterium]